ncbi:MAG: phosphoribosylanthranilate isomerase [Lachnospiraceae bacterium]|nr:phosphoribosylanthranilate isomerase [Lachnospiraceae bacterium]
MTRIKLCGITRAEDITVINRLRPEYAGFVFFRKSRRCVSREQAEKLRGLLDPAVKTVGVFVNEPAENVAGLLDAGVIGLAQLHGDEDEDYISRLRTMTEAPVIKAFRIGQREDLEAARASSADHILLDAGMGDGIPLPWEWLTNLDRPYFLAGGLSPDNVEKAIGMLHPWGVDVSSGIETDGVKDAEKMRRFAEKVRSTDRDRQLQEEDR